MCRLLCQPNEARRCEPTEESTHSCRKGCSYHIRILCCSASLTNFWLTGCIAQSVGLANSFAHFRSTRACSVLVCTWKSIGSFGVLDVYWMASNGRVAQHLECVASESSSTRWNSKYFPQTPDAHFLCLVLIRLAYTSTYSSCIVCIGEDRLIFRPNAWTGAQLLPQTA